MPLSRLSSFLDIFNLSSVGILKCNLSFKQNESDWRQVPAICREAILKVLFAFVFPLQTSNQICITKGDYRQKKRTKWSFLPMHIHHRTSVSIVHMWNISHIKTRSSDFFSAFHGFIVLLWDDFASSMELQALESSLVMGVKTTAASGVSTFSLQNCV